MKANLNKKGASIPVILIGLLVVSAFMVSIGTIMGDMREQYPNVTITTQFDEQLSNYNTTLRSIQNQTSEVRNRTGGTQATQTVDTGISVTGALKALNLVWDSFGIAQTMIESVATFLHLPSIWVWVAIGSLIITITFLFLSAVLKNPL